LKTHRVTVHAHVKELLEKKYVVRFSSRASRSLIPVDELEKQGKAQAAAEIRTGDTAETPDEPAGDASPLLLPLAGRIAAGQPIEAVYDNEVIDIAALFPRERDLYVLEVTGDSMIDDQIRSGDYVVVERRSTARNGEIVVAVLPSLTGGSGEATLKRLYREGSRIRLQPANPAMLPIYVDAPSQLEIRGVVVGVVRRYH
jgi:repressor LexA